MKNTVLPILLATAWISVSEFLRNQFLISDYWVEHYKKMGQVFPAEPVNGAIWGVWSLCYAIGIFIISRKFSLMQTFFLSWFTGFAWMWIVLGNLNVLPFGILPIAVPLSLLEAFVASFIVHRLFRSSHAQ